MLKGISSDSPMDFPKATLMDFRLVIPMDSQKDSRKDSLRVTQKVILKPKDFPKATQMVILKAIQMDSRSGIRSVTPKETQKVIRWEIPTQKVRD
jgi:hypothetical protein